MENEQNQSPAPTPVQSTPPPTTATPVTNTPAAEVPTLDNNTLMAILCYVGPLVIIPFLMAKDVPFVKFHIKQGIVLAAGGLVLYVLSQFYLLSYGPFGMVLTLLSLALLILSIVGIINVLKKKEADIPLTGQFTKHFNI